MIEEIVKNEKRRRDSNIELFRILTMIMIVAHHYVVNSGLTNNDCGPVSSDPTNMNSLYLLLLGAWGKIGINCFVMITGYFMCQSKITLTKYVKLLFEIMFYKIVIGFIFMVSGYQEFTLLTFASLFFPIMQIADNFIGCYLVFFLFIPYLNILIKNIGKRQHLFLVLLCLITYVLFGTIKGGPFIVTMNYVSWFCVIYIIASFIRLYPQKWYSNNSICGVCLFVTIVLSIASVVISAFVGKHIGVYAPYYFVADSNSLLAVLVGIFAFLFFLNLKIKYNNIINIVASSTFSVLLIHANSDTMRQWLWKDVFDNVGHYGQYVYPIISILLVFSVCVAIDFFIKNTIEKVFFKFWDRISHGINNRLRVLENKYFN